MSASGGGSVREGAAALVESAAKAGMHAPWRLAARTPREIELEFSAFARRRQEEAERMDLLAWLVGRYVLIGMHAPKRYPRRPDAIRRAAGEMTEMQMKKVFVDIAARREARGNGDC